MQYTSRYPSPLGEIFLAADEIGLTGLWFTGQKHFPASFELGCIQPDFPTLELTKRWLDVYFSQQIPDVPVPLHFTGTVFQERVWKALSTIPYGTTMTYGQIARQMAEDQGCSQVSARAVGGAIGRNKLSIIVPCHRVIGADGSLTGYAGGVERKRALLRLESAL